MIFPFISLAGDPEAPARPGVDVIVGAMGEVLVPCLVDSGAMNTLLPGWVADLAGIDCDGVPSTDLGFGGAGTTARMVPTLLRVGDHSWEAEVGFCDPWPRGWGVLGLRSFFRYFTVTLRAADFELEIEPVRR